MKLLFQIKFLLLGLFLFSFSAFCGEKAELIYEDYLGEYFVGSKYRVEIDLQADSPSSIYDKLLRLATNSKSDLLLIGYGVEDTVSNYFAGTRGLGNKTIFSENRLFHNLKLESGSKFYFRFVNPHYSIYANPNSPDHHSLSPFRHLNAIGKLVTYF